MNIAPQRRPVVLFEVAHPKHYLQFRALMRALRETVSVVVLARDKDVVLQLLEADGTPYHRYGENPHGLGRKVLAVPRRLREYADLLRRFRPDLIISRSSPYAAALGRFFGATTVVMPDSEGVVLNERFVIPRSDVVVTPANYRRDYGARHHRVNGTFETAYLHPQSFTPDAGVLEQLGLANEERYAVVRFVAWSANHDARKRGFTAEDRVRLVQTLEREARVLVSAEGTLSPELEKRRIRIAPSQIHSVLHFASLYIGDSQTMATEAALLGTPAIRCNSFVGEADFSNFRMLEEQYGLLFNYSVIDQAIDKGVELLRTPDAKQQWQERRAAYFASVGDINAETLDIVRQLLVRGAKLSTEAAADTIIVRTSEGAQ